MTREERYWSEYNRLYAEFLDTPNTSEEQAKIAAMRHLARTDLYFFASEIFDMKDARDPITRRKMWDERIHGPMCDYYQAEDDALLVFGRNMLKSTVGKIWIVWLIARDPNVRIGMWSKTSELVKSMLASIKQMCGNKHLMELFPEIFIPRKRGKGGKWEVDRSDALLMARPEDGRAVGATEAQVEAWGVTSSVVGRHYDYQYYDDPIDQNNTNTPTAIMNMEQWWGGVQSLKSPGTIQKYIGTPYSPMDLIHLIKKQQLFDLIIERPACNEDISVIYYSFFTKKWLQRQKRIISDDRVFAAQYALSTRPRADNIFPEPYLTYDEVMFPKDPKFYITVDPAAYAEAHHDKTGICVSAVSRSKPDSVFYVEAEGVHKRSMELVDHLVEKIKRYHPVMIGVEWGQQIALKELLLLKLREAQKEQSFPFPAIKDIPTGKTAKADRLNATIGAMIRGGRAYFHPSLKELFLQLQHFNPRIGTNEDDVIDSAALAIQTIEHFSPAHWKMGIEKPTVGFTLRDLLGLAEKEHVPWRERLFAH